MGFRKGLHVIDLSSASAKTLRIIITAGNTFFGFSVRSLMYKICFCDVSISLGLCCDLDRTSNVSVMHIFVRGSQRLTILFPCDVFPFESNCLKLNNNTFPRL